MTDKPNHRATKANPNEENWLVQKLTYTDDVPVLGFLQLCADRRFHRYLQKRFQKDAKLKSPTDYWIHADAGGTPKMEKQLIAPDYCYKKKGVRLMGWSAHGDGCGGFGEEVKDEVIKRALLKTFKVQRKRYKDARHFCYFVTAKKKGATKETVVYSLAG